MLITIVAIDEKKGIGLKGKLPWHLKEDLQLFKQNTLHHNILMGQTTYDHMPRKLKDRHTVVCTIDPEYKIEGDDDAEVLMILDPLDGTSNAMRNMPCYGISIALADLTSKTLDDVTLDDIEIAYVKNFPTGDAYSAVKGKGALKNNEKITPSFMI